MSISEQIPGYHVDDRKSTTSSSGVSLLAILPLLTTYAIDLNPELGYKVAEVNGNDIYTHSLGDYPSKYIDDVNGTDTGIEYSIVSTSEVSELQVLENFVANILQNSVQQPAELNSYMYDNIDDLLIAD